MIVVDAGVLIAFLDPDDARHLAAIDVLASAVPPLIVHPITAAEMLVAPTRRGFAEAVWSDLSAIGVELDTLPIDALLLAELRVTTGCKMPDCCVISSSMAHRSAVATFDERLRKHVTVV